MCSLHCTFDSTRPLQFWTIALVWLSFACFAPTALHAQTSTCAPDASGDFKPTASVICQLPANGEFSYRDVVIPPFVLVSFQRNARNTPVTIRASGNVTISGSFNLDGAVPNGRLGGKGGPGGFDGGRGGSFVDFLAGIAGDGPGGGLPGAAGGNTGGGGSFATKGGALTNSTGNGVAGQIYGTATLLPLIGGSGGGGSGASSPQGIAGGGGGGGGAILIACAGTIKFDYQSDNSFGVYARGGWGTFFEEFRSGGGSGGAIRLVANVIMNTGTIRPNLSVEGGTSDGSFNRIIGGLGYLRVEARDLSQFTSNASATISTSLTPGPAVLANTPQLRIQSVGGQAAPANSIGSFYQQPDITVPTTVTNPVTVAVQGTNLPASTTVQVTLTQESGAKETKTCALTNAACNVSLTLPSTGISVITASTILDVLIALGRPLTIEGERVDKVEIAAGFGTASRMTYITKSGRRVAASE